MKPKLYLESTIPSYLVARLSRDTILIGQQKCTRDWWNKRAARFEIFVSEVVVGEISSGETAMAARRMELIKPFALLESNDAVKALTRVWFTAGRCRKKPRAMPRTSRSLRCMACTSC